MIASVILTHSYDPSRAAHVRTSHFSEMIPTMPTTAFLLTSLLVVLAPGTGVVYTVSTSLSLGRRASLYAALGCTAGILPHLAAMLGGVAALLHASALAFQSLKWAGVAYLLYVGWNTWKDRGLLEVDATSERRSPTQIATRALLLNILNPKLTLFFLAFLPQFVDSRGGPALPQLVMLSGLFMAMTFVVFAIYGLVAHVFRRRVIDSPRVQDWMRRGFGAGYAALALDMALARER